MCTGKSEGLDELQLEKMRAFVPNMHVHADLAAFAEALVRSDRVQHGPSDQNDTLYGHTQFGGPL